jgi:hypothetical protein
MYPIEPDGFLCLDCAYKVEKIRHTQFLREAALANQALDEMDMALGMRTTGGRIPVAELAGAMRGKSSFNNITINNSQVGVVSTGDLARIDAVITLTKGTDAEEIGHLIRDLTQAVIDEATLSGAQRSDIVDLLQALSEEVVGAQGRSKPPVIKTLAGEIRSRTHDIAALSSIASALLAAVERLFG